MSTALLIGVGQYEQASYAALSAPAQDVRELHELLRHPEIGACRKSDITTLNDPTVRELRNAVEILCSNRRPDELVLIYFSGYGIIDDRGQLFLPCRDTDPARLDQTAYSSAEMVACLEACRSQQQVIILDCCFSGSYAKGMVGVSDSDLIGKQLSSKRRALLTSPWAIDYSAKHKSGNPSTYTQYLLNGLSTGMADGGVHRPLEGKISAIELHHYIRTHIEEDLPALFPKFYSVGQSADIIIAMAPYLEFRREVVALASRGDISIVGHNILEELRLKLGIPPEIANAIRQDALSPYQQQAQKKRQFEDIQAEVSRRETPLSDNTQTELRRLQEVYEIEGAPMPTTPVTQAPTEPGVNNGTANGAVNSGAIAAETPLNEPSEPPTFKDRVSQLLGNFPTPLRSAPTELGEGEASSAPNTGSWLVGLAGLAALVLLSAVFWAAFTPLASRTNLQLNSPTDWFNEAFRRASRGDRNAAIDAYTQAINLNPNNPNFFYNRGIEYAKLGDRDRAINDYNSAIQLNPAFADAYFNRANAYANRGDRTAALRDYREAERLYGQQGATELRRDAQNAIRNLERQP